VSGALYVPGADRTSRWFLDDYPGQYVMPRIDKTLLHSTETPKSGSCPGYSGGGTAPQITINPWRGFRRMWQHFPINRAGRALGNPSSTPVSENKDNVFQVEIIGYSDPTLGRRYGCYLPELAGDDLDYLVEMLAFVHREWPHPTTLPSTWPLYKVSSWDAMGAAHMSSDAYDRFAGILAHLHAPKPSTHGDVALNIRALKSKLDARLTGNVTPPPSDTYGKFLTEDGILDTATRKAVQRLLGVDADGDWGPVTWRALQRKAGLTGAAVDGIPGPVTDDAVARLVGRPDLVGSRWSWAWTTAPTEHTRGLEQYYNRAVRRGWSPS
jgi:peptidoglycan hydrolase-like protein with peptidoglycan-binding domain